MTAQAITGIKFKLLLTASALVFAIAGPADARKRQPAPIVYAGQGGTQPASTGQRQAPQIAAQRPAQAQTQTQTQTQSLAPSGARIEFRYPDQPDVFFNANGTRQVEGAAPMSFSSSTSAISETDARQYASARVPAHSTPSTVRDPAITAGGFDARAAARNVTENSSVTPRVEPPQDSAANLQQVAMNAPAPRPVVATPAPTPVSTQATAQTNLPYQPVAQPGYDETGLASVYDAAFAGTPTANGEILNMSGMMAAHPTLPLPSLVQIINEENGREVVVRVNDRGPFEDNRLIQVSGYAAEMLGFQPSKAPRVRVRYLGPAPVLASGATAPQPNVTEAIYTPPTTEITRAPVVEIAALPTRLPVPDPVSASAGYAMGSHYIQAGSFADISNAQRLHASLSGNYDVDIVPVRVRGADFFRVMIGPLSGKPAATSLRDQLAYQGIANGIVVTRD